MPITWKQQHLNNSCVPACLAMLLSQHDVQKEDFNIIHESYRPYLVEYDENKNAYTAGILVQTEEVMSIIPNNYGFDLVNEMYTDFDEYWQRVLELSNKAIGFITSLPQGFIPAKGYKQNGSTRGHAVVVEKVLNDTVHILDPDGGIDRSLENKFETVQDYVSYKISKADFRKIIRHRERLIIGNLAESSSRKTDIDSLLTASIKNVEGYADIAKQEMEKFTAENGIIIYDDFFDFIIRILKPFIMDLRLALDTISIKTKDEADLIEFLQLTYDETRKIQEMMKDGPNISLQSELILLCNSLELLESKMIKVIEHKRNRLEEEK